MNNDFFDNFKQEKFNKRFSFFFFQYFSIFNDILNIMNKKLTIINTIKFFFYRSVTSPPFSIYLKIAEFLFIP